MLLVCAMQKVRDVFGVGPPFFVERIRLRVVACFRGSDEIRGDQNVFFEQRRELVSRVLAVVRRDRAAKFGLVLQQPLCRRVFVRQISGGADDEEPSPRHVIDPQLSHSVVELASGLGGGDCRHQRRR
jgi:hypothetical protein